MCVAIKSVLFSKRLQLGTMADGLVVDPVAAVLAEEQRSADIDDDDDDTSAPPPEPEKPAKKKKKKPPPPQTVKACTMATPTPVIHGPYEYPCSACGSARGGKIGGYTIVCAACGGRTHSNSAVKEYDLTMNTSQARSLLQEMLEALDAPANARRIRHARKAAKRAVKDHAKKVSEMADSLTVHGRKREAKQVRSSLMGMEAAGPEISRAEERVLVEHVMPVMMSILLDVLEPYGYAHDNHGLQMALGAMHRCSHDLDVAAMLHELRARFCVGTLWEEEKRVAEEEARRLADEKQREAEAKRLAKEAAQREARQKKEAAKRHQQLLDKLRGLDPQSLVVDSVGGRGLRWSAGTIVWPRAPLRLECNIRRTLDVEWVFNNAVQGPIWRPARVSHVIADGTYNLKVQPTAEDAAVAEKRALAELVEIEKAERRAERGGAGRAEAEARRETGIEELSKEEKAEKEEARRNAVKKEAVNKLVEVLTGVPLHRLRARDPATIKEQGNHVRRGIREDSPVWVARPRMPMTKLDGFNRDADRNATATPWSGFNCHISRRACPSGLLQSAVTVRAAAPQHCGELGAEAELDGFDHGISISGSDRVFRLGIHDPSSEKPAKVALGAVASCVAFSPDGRFLAVGSNTGAGLTIWRLQEPVPVPPPLASGAKLHDPHTKKGAKDAGGSAHSASSSPSKRKTRKRAGDDSAPGLLLGENVKITERYIESGTGATRQRQARQCVFKILHVPAPLPGHRDGEGHHSDEHEHDDHHHAARGKEVGTTDLDLSVNALAWSSDGHNRIVLAAATDTDVMLFSLSEGPPALPKSPSPKRTTARDRAEAKAAEEKKGEEEKGGGGGQTTADDGALLAEEKEEAAGEDAEAKAKAEAEAAEVAAAEAKAIQEEKARLEAEAQAEAKAAAASASKWGLPSSVMVRHVYTRRYFQSMRLGFLSLRRFEAGAGRGRRAGFHSDNDEDDDSDLEDDGSGAVELEASAAAAAAAEEKAQKRRWGAPQRSTTFIVAVGRTEVTAAYNAPEAMGRLDGRVQVLAVEIQWAEAEREADERSAAAARAVAQAELDAEAERRRAVAGIAERRHTKKRAVGTDEDAPRVALDRSEQARAVQRERGFPHRPRGRWPGVRRQPLVRLRFKGAPITTGELSVDSCSLAVVCSAADPRDQVRLVDVSPALDALPWGAWPPRRDTASADGDGEDSADEGIAGAMGVRDLRVFRRTLREGVRGWVGAVAWSPEGTRLALAERGGGKFALLSVWAANLGTAPEEIDTEPGAKVQGKHEGEEKASARGGGGDDGEEEEESDEESDDDETKARKAVEAAQGEAETKHAARQANGGKGILRMSSTAAQHGAVTALAWAPDGQWLLSAGEDTTLRVFRARGGAAIFACAGHKKPVRAQNRPVELMR